MIKKQVEKIFSTEVTPSPIASSDDEYLGDMNASMDTSDNNSYGNDEIYHVNILFRKITFHLIARKI